jgi:hypothetical protein
LGIGSTEGAVVLDHGALHFPGLVLEAPPTMIEAGQAGREKGDIVGEWFGI